MTTARRSKTTRAPKAPKEPAPYKPNEVAQIVLNCVGAPPLILRYRTEAKAIDAHAKLTKAWAEASSGKRPPVVKVDGDMFSSTIDLFEFTNASLVLHRVRNKFKPIP